MADRKYNIGYFAVDWNYELVDLALHGLKQFTDTHRNVYLRIFDCFGKDLDNSKDKSEYRIFSLPDLSGFDGVVLLGNQIILQRVRDEPVRRPADPGKPDRAQAGPEGTGRPGGRIRNPGHYPRLPPARMRPGGS